MNRLATSASTCFILSPFLNVFAMFVFRLYETLWCQQRLTSGTKMESKTMKTMKTTRWLTVALAILGMFALSGVTSAEDADGTTNWFGGPIYEGQPTLEVTAALILAGGGPKDFAFDKALVSMLGEKTVTAEVAKLKKQYGEKAVNGFVGGMTWAVKDAIGRATEAKVSLPEPPDDLKGVKLAKALVEAGVADGTWWAGHMFDRLLSHDIHNQVMADVDAEFGHDADHATHKILNQAMYDVAQALGYKDVKLAPMH